MTEDDILRAQLKDMAERAYRQNIYVYSAFLNPAELAILDDMRQDIAHVDYETYGCMPSAERQMVGFGSERMLGYKGKWPIALICIEPLLEKFAEEINHRDILGSVMNLGIKRSVLGDIMVKDKKAYIACQDSMASYIMENLTRVRHTNVRCRVIEDGEAMQELAPTLEDIECIVASPRFDAVIAALTKNSRTAVSDMFKAGKVTLNGRVCEKTSLNLKPQDTFSVRGYGKYIYVGEERETRKGRLYVKLKAYK